MKEIEMNNMLIKQVSFNNTVEIKLICEDIHLFLYSIISDKESELKIQMRDRLREKRRKKIMKLIYGY